MNLLIARVGDITFHYQTIGQFANSRLVGGI
jgi:hypothetical protein